MQRLVALVVFMFACRDDNASVRSWVQAWEAARACLVPIEYGHDAATAFLIGGMIEDTWPCAMKLKYLVADAPRSIPAGALEDLNALEMGDAHAFARVDAAIARVREDAAIAPAARPSARPLRPLPAGQSIIVDGAPLPLALTQFVHDHLEARLPRGSVDLHVEARALDHVDITRTPRDAVLAYPSRSWSAQLAEDSLTIVEQDGRSARVRFANANGVAAFAAMDHGSNRVVLLGRIGLQHLTLARSGDGGRTWRIETQPTRSPFRWWWQDHATGVTDVLTFTAWSMIHRFDPAEPGTITDLYFDGSDRSRRCGSGARFWVYQPHGSGLVRVTLPTTLRLDVEVADVACRNAAALTWNTRSSSVHKCEEHCEEVLSLRSRSLDDGAGTLLPDGTWLYITRDRHLLLAWREGRDVPSAHRLQREAALEGVVVFRDVPHVALRDGERLMFVPIPLD